MGIRWFWHVIHGIPIDGFLPSQRCKTFSSTDRLIPIDPDRFQAHTDRTTNLGSR